MAELIYTLGTSNPEMVDIHDDYEQLKAYNGMLEALSVHGKHQFNSVLLSTLRFSIAYLEQKPGKVNRIHESIVNEFMNVEFDDVVDSDELYLVERVIAEDFDFYLRPLRTLSIDVRVLKAVLVRNMSQSGMDWGDIKIVSSYYNLGQYLECVNA
ncbi:MAG TPA: hypothetical protein VJ508_05545, partial [Saprospiraceae bacterium]|nr:hypothetical protein [Saprospiraceae bacterium]